MSYQPKVYKEPGGNRQVVASGGALDVESGGEIDIESGGSLKLAGTAVDATAAEINRACDVSARIVNVTGDTLALSIATHDGKIVTLNRAGGIATTLPAATGSGAHFRLLIGTTFTSAATIKVVGNDTMKGTCLYLADGGDTVVGFETAADSDTISFDGTNTGGYVGTEIELIDIAADTWFVRILGSATANEATPFSATVS